MAERQGDLLDEVNRFCEQTPPESSVYAVLHRERDRLLPDEMFADLFSHLGRLSGIPYRRDMPEVGRSRSRPLPAAGYWHEHLSGGSGGRCRCRSAQRRSQSHFRVRNSPIFFSMCASSSLSVSFSSARRYGRRWVEPNACRRVSCRLLHRLEAVTDGFQTTEPVFVVGLRRFVLEGLVLTR